MRLLFEKGPAIGVVGVIQHGAMAWIDAHANGHQALRIDHAHAVDAVLAISICDDRLGNIAQAAIDTFLHDCFDSGRGRPRDISQELCVEFRLMAH